MACFTAGTKISLDLGRGAFEVMSEISLDAKCGVEDSGILFLYVHPWFGVFGPSFPKMLSCPAYPKSI